MAFSVSNGNGARSGLGRRRFGAGNGTLSEINIVPLVDVVLVLLIIFMLTAHVMEFGLEINVPEVKQVKDTNEELPVISITRNGKMYLNEKPININQIATEVPKRFKNSEKRLRDGRQSHGLRSHRAGDQHARSSASGGEAGHQAAGECRPVTDAEFRPSIPIFSTSREPLSRAFLAALTLHVTLIAGMGIYGWVSSHHESFGAQNAGGGAIGIEAVKSIPLLHSGEQNPVANDTESQVPQQPAKPIEQEKEEKVSPNAVALKMKQKKRLPADVASEQQNFRPFKEIDQNQVFAKQAPQVSNPLFSAMPGSGRIGTGANTTLGTRFAGYAPADPATGRAKMAHRRRGRARADRARRHCVFRSDARRQHSQSANRAAQRHFRAGLFRATRHTGSKPVSADSSGIR